MTVNEKGYAVDAQHKWLYPPRHMPPKGQKLHLLTRGKVAIHGEWRWDGGFVAWQYLPKQDWKEELAALQFIENGMMEAA